MAFLLIFGAAAHAFAAKRAYGADPLAAWKRSGAGRRLRLAGAAAWPFLLLAQAAFPRFFPAPWPAADTLPVKLAGIVFVSLGFALAAAQLIESAEALRREAAGSAPVGPRERWRSQGPMAFLFMQAGAFALSPQYAFAASFLLAAWGVFLENKARS